MSNATDVADRINAGFAELRERLRADQQPNPDLAREANEKARRDAENRTRLEYGEIIATVRNQGDMVEAFRKIKAMLNLTDAHCDELACMVEGHTNKCLGPSEDKQIGPLTFNRFCWMFAVQFEMKIDLEQMKVMAEHWDDRQRRRPPEYSETKRVSAKLLEKAKPHVLSAHGKQMNTQRNCKLSGELRSKIARKAGKSRMRKVTKSERSAMARKGWETRRQGKLVQTVTAISRDEHAEHQNLILGRGEILTAAE